MPQRFRQPRPLFLERYRRTHLLGCSTSKQKACNRLMTGVTGVTGVTGAKGVMEPGVQPPQHYQPQDSVPRAHRCLAFLPSSQFPCVLNHLLAASKGDSIREIGTDFLSLLSLPLYPSLSLLPRLIHGPTGRSNHLGKGAATSRLHGL